MSRSLDYPPLWCICQRGLKMVTKNHIKEGCMVKAAGEWLGRCVLLLLSLGGRLLLGSLDEPPTNDLLD
ncbi:unnamed protein product [Arabis nemorensis]|uniref:Uncharacterized protein n=1 Tax=Arabis nemorensis TaxID=586526 RepID=A0A565CCJ2_9BRAS|nr:unnamed protein product [Arabis nemorensis]